MCQISRIRTQLRRRCRVAADVCRDGVCRRGKLDSRVITCRGRIPARVNGSCHEERVRGGDRIGLRLSHLRVGEYRVGRDTRTEHLARVHKVAVRVERSHVARSGACHLVRLAGHVRPQTLDRACLCEQVHTHLGATLGAVNEHKVLWNKVDFRTVARNFWDSLLCHNHLNSTREPSLMETYSPVLSISLSPSKLSGGML